jgi:hypothetical protein
VLAHLAESRSFAIAGLPFMQEVKCCTVCMWGGQCIIKKRISKKEKFKHCTTGLACYIKAAAPLQADLLDIMERKTAN